MTFPRAAAAGLGLAAATALLAGCGGGGSSPSSQAAATTSPVVHHHHHPSPPPSAASASASASTAPTPQVTVTVTRTASSPLPTPAPPTIQNLTATSVVQQSLVAAGAQSHGLKASDYTGLVPGQTYYAYDAKDALYWAGAGLVPSSSSQAAQVSVQDDGSYLIYRRSGDGSWTVTSVGLAGIAGSTCPVKVPAAVLAIWHWKPHTCRPPAS